MSFEDPRKLSKFPPADEIASIDMLIGVRQTRQLRADTRFDTAQSMISTRVDLVSAITTSQERPKDWTSGYSEEV